MTNASGVQFGIGDSATNPFWADINVVENKSVIYDFVANAPYAQWKSGGGPLPFPGTSGDSRGYAFQVTSPHLEDDSIDSLPGLLTVPQNKYNGYIQATYPEFQVQQGDTLQTLVNCEFGAAGCYATFRVDYLSSTGVQRTLWSWRESYDKRFYRANINLSPLAGQKVRFVLMLLSSGLASGDRAIWGAPRIVRSGATQPPAPPATLTALPPLTPTPTPFGQPPPPISSPGCDKASFVADVTVPDGTLFSPGAAFTKTWRLKNAGTCTWTTAYKYLFYSGEQMSAPTSINLPWNVSPGQTVDLTVNMVAPASSGKYRGYWILSNAAGSLFGIGTGAANAIWVEINVAGDNPIGTGYDFAANACSAEWKSAAGILPCPGTEADARGFILKQDAPKLEDSSTGAPGLLTFPQNRYNGQIQGFYPTFTVQPGDRFQTTVGCENGASCYVTFRLDYMNANGSIKTFWTRREKNEKQYYAANVDLGPLVGQSLRFILTVNATGYATNDRAIWGSPRIVRVGGAPPTVTPAPPTATPTPTNAPGPIVTSPVIRSLSMIDSSNGWATGDAYLL
ncbi:MAG: NBR1-Ig-like domain-containing protein, partial [Candidatus Binatia bacterium]